MTQLLFRRVLRKFYLTTLTTFCNVFFFPPHINWVVQTTGLIKLVHGSSVYFVLPFDHSHTGSQHCLTTESHPLAQQDSSHAFSHFHCMPQLKSQYEIHASDEVKSLPIKLCTTFCIESDTESYDFMIKYSGTTITFIFEGLIDLIASTFIHSFLALSELSQIFISKVT